MNLRPFQIEINRHPPFIGLFESSSAALDAFHALAAAEARIGNGFRLAVQPYRPEGEGNACIERQSFAASLPEGGEGAGSVEPADRPVDAAVSNNDRHFIRAAWLGIALAGSSGRDMHIEIEHGASAQETRDAFLTARQTGIGGSDIGAILGVSSFKSAVDVFLAKTAPNPSDAQTELTYWGHAVEPIIARHPQHDWMVGNLDGIIPGPPAGVLEIKNVSAFGTQAWGANGSDEVPLTYVAQVAWYMAVQSMDYAVIAALFGGNAYREFRVERDLELEQALIRKGHAFWFNHVLTGVAPEPQTPDEAIRLFKQDDGSVLNADDALLECCAQLKDAQARAQCLNDEVERLEVQIKARMGHTARLAYRDQLLATWKTHSARRFNARRLKPRIPICTNSLYSSAKRASFV